MNLSLIKLLEDRKIPFNKLNDCVQINREHYSFDNFNDLEKDYDFSWLDTTFVISLK